MPDIRNVVIAPLTPGDVGNGASVAPLPFRGSAIGLQTQIEAGEGIIVEHGATWVISLDDHTHAQSEVTGLVDDLAAKAPLASPTFTGAPAAPTAAPGTDTTQLATTAFVNAAIVGVGGGGGTAATTTFAPTGSISSTNVQAALAELDSEKAALAHTHLWADITDKPTTFAPSAHTHPQSEVTGLVGDLALKAPLADPDFTGEIDLTGAAGTSRLYYAKTAAARRWGWGAESSTESGSESGSDFVLRAYNDAGVYYGDVFQVERSTLETSFWEDVHFLGGADFDGAVQTKTTQRAGQSVTATASTTVNRANGDYVDLTMSASITTLTLSGWPASGTMGQVHLAITFTGAFTITWPAAVKWPGGTAPTLTGVNGKADHIMLVSDNGGSTIWGFVMGQNYDA